MGAAPFWAVRPADSSALPADRERALDAGFDGHVAKPPSVEQLEAMLAPSCAGVGD